MIRHLRLLALFSPLFTVLCAFALPSDLPLGVFYPYGMEKDYNLPDNLRQHEWRKTREYFDNVDADFMAHEKALYEYLGATYIINPKIPLTCFLKYGILDQTSMGVVCDIDPIPEINGTAIDDWWYSNVAYNMGNAVNLYCTLVDTVAPIVDWDSNITNMVNIYKNISLFESNSDHFFGYWLGEEQIRPMNGHPTFALNGEQIEMGYEHLNAIIDTILTFKKQRNTAPIITGNCLSWELMDKHIEHHDIEKTILLNQYGRIIPNAMTDFFDQVNKWNVFYQYDYIFGGAFTEFYNNQYSGRNNYQTIIHDHLYKLRWLADKIYRAAQLNDQTNSKEFWYMMMPQRMIKYDNTGAGDVFLNLRRMTEIEIRMMANLALACGAKGIHIYTMASSYYGGQTVDEIRSSGVNASRSFTSGLLDGMDYGTFYENRFRRPFGTDNLGTHHDEELFNGDISGYSYGDYEEDAQDIIDTPYDYVRKIFDPDDIDDDDIRDELSLLRNMHWVTTTNAHDSVMYRTLYPSQYFDSTYYAWIEDDSLLYSRRPSYDTRRPGVQLDVSRVGIAGFSFHIKDVLDEYCQGDSSYDAGVESANFPDDWEDDYYLRWSSNITLGLFKWPSEDPDAEYYYVVNTKNHKGGPSGTVIAADPDTIRLAFDYPSWGTSTLIDRVSGASIPLTYVDEELDDYYLTGSIVLEPGEGRLLRFTRSRQGTSGSITSDATWSGVVHVTGDVQVKDGAKLTIDPGTRVLFDAGTRIQVNDGTIKAEGDPGDEIIFASAHHTLANDGSHSRDDWDGIVLYGHSGVHEHHFNHCVVDGAAFGIVFLQDADKNDLLYVDNSEFKNCGYGIYSFIAGDVHLTENTIHDCDYGIKCQGGNQDHYLMNNTVSRITHRGITLDGVENGYVYGGVVEHCGEDGLYISNAISASLRGYNESTDSIRFISRYNGSSDPRLYAGVEINASYLTYYKYCKVYENPGTGLLLKNKPSLRISQNNTFNFFGNNGLYGTVSDTNSSRTHIFLEKYTDWDLSTASYDFFTSNDRIPAGISPYYLSVVDDMDRDISGNWWGHTPLDELVDSPADLATDSTWDYFWAYTGVTKHFTCANVKQSILEENEDYYLLYDTEIDQRPLILDQAYVWLDSLDNAEEAEDLFEELVEEHYSPALRGACFAKSRKGMTVDEIVSWLTSIPEDSSYMDFNQEIDFTKAFYYQYARRYEDARDILSEMAENGIDTPDSLRILIAIEEVNRLEAEELLFGSGGGHGIQSLGQTKHQIEVVNDREHSLRKLLNDYYNGKNNTTSHLIPTVYTISKAYPNPFNSYVSIEFGLPVSGKMELTVYNLLGQQVKQLISSDLKAGYHAISWNGQSDAGVAVSSGMYFLTLQANGIRQTKKMIMMK